MNTLALGLPLIQALDAVAESEPQWSRVGSDEKLIVILGLAFAFLVASIILTTIVIIAIQKAKRNERLVALAIEHRQGDVARDLLRAGPSKIAWLVIGLVAVVLIACLPWYATLVVAIVTVATFPAWGPILLGRDRKESRRGAAHTPKVSTKIETNVAPDQPAGTDTND